MLVVVREATVGHGVGAQDAVFRVEYVVDDFSRSENLRFTSPFARAVSNDVRTQFLRALVVHQQYEVVCDHMVENKVRHPLEKRLHGIDRTDCLSDFVHEVPRGDGVGRFRWLEDDAVCGCVDRGEDGRSALAAGHVEVDQIADRLRTAEALDVFLAAEDQECAADFDLIAVLKSCRRDHALAVEVGAVGALQVFENPRAVAGANFRVPT